MSKEKNMVYYIYNMGKQKNNIYEPNECSDIKSIVLGSIPNGKIRGL